MIDAYPAIPWDHVFRRHLNNSFQATSIKCCPHSEQYIASCRTASQAMTSNSPNQAKRRSERNRDKAADQSSERELECTLPTHRRSHHSGKAARATQQVVNINYNYNFNGDGTTIKGDAFLGPVPDAPSRSHPLPARPNSRVSQLRKKAKERISIDDNENSDESSIYSSRSRDSSRSRQTRHASTRPVVNLLDNAGLDEGYGTSSIQGDRATKAKAKAKGKERGQGKGKENMEYGKPSAPARRNRKAKSVSSESESEETSISGDETHLAERGNDEEDSDDDDEFAKMITVAGANNEAFEVKAILDTGTGPDWISQWYLTDVLNLKASKDKNNKYSDKNFSDFQGKPFKASGTVELMISSDEFEGVSFRNQCFLVSRKSTFKILIGKTTIKKEKLLAHKPREILGDAAHIGLQPKLSKKEEAEVARRKDDQDRQAAEQGKKREEKRKARSKEKQEGRSRPANFAQESKAIDQRRSRSKSPSSSKTSSKSKPKARVMEEKASLESLEGSW